MINFINIEDLVEEIQQKGYVIPDGFSTEELINRLAKTYGVDEVLRVSKTRNALQKAEELIKDAKANLISTAYLEPYGREKLPLILLLWNFVKDAVRKTDVFDLEYLVALEESSLKAEFVIKDIPSGSLRKIFSDCDYLSMNHVRLLRETAKNSKEELKLMTIVSIQDFDKDCVKLMEDYRNEIERWAKYFNAYGDTLQSAQQRIYKFNELQDRGKRRVNFALASNDWFMRFEAEDLNKSKTIENLRSEREKLEGLIFTPPFVTNAKKFEGKKLIDWRGNIIRFNSYQRDYEPRSFTLGEFLAHLKSCIESNVYLTQVQRAEDFIEKYKIFEGGLTYEGITGLDKDFLEKLKFITGNWQPIYEERILKVKNRYLPTEEWNALNRANPVFKYAFNFDGYVIASESPEDFLYDSRLVGVQSLKLGDIEVKTGILDFLVNRIKEEQNISKKR